jgi:hypothetical protein
MLSDFSNVYVHVIIQRLYSVASATVQYKMICEEFIRDTGESTGRKKNVNLVVGKSWRMFNFVTEKFTSEDRFHIEISEITDYEKDSKFSIEGRYAIYPD